MVGFRLWGTGNLPKASLARRGPPIDPVSLYVWRAPEDRRQQFIRQRTLWQDNTARRRLQRIYDNWFRNRLGIFPGAADQIASVLRDLDVRWHIVFHRPGGIFLFYLRQTQSRAETGSCARTGIVN